MSKLKFYEIENKAEKLLEGFMSFPLRIIELIEKKLQYQIEYLDIDEKSANLAGKVNHENKIIYINPHDSPQRQRFTLAHEVGHIVLHNDGTAEQKEHCRREDIRNDELNIYSVKEQETQSNFFAACLLMPATKFKEIWELTSSNIDKIALYFNVSRLAASVRANSLGLLEM